MFKTFPEFSKLTLNDRAEYESYIKDFPPIADMSFASVMTWWNGLGQAAASVLNDNLIVSYWVPGFEAEAGLALIGVNKVDESFCSIFDYLAIRGETPKLVCVPEFVVGHVRYPDLFHFKEQRADCEYIVSAAKFAHLDATPSWKRQKIQHQLQQMEGLHWEVRPLDLTDPKELALLLETTKKWWGKNINNIGKIERDAMHMAIKDHTVLDFQNVCLLVEGRLLGFCLYRRPSDQAYAIIHFIKATGNKVLGYELISHLFAKYFYERGVKKININTDAGNLRLRMFMLSLGPSNYFRKYSVKPV
jgi:hypothetical protein